MEVENEILENCCGERGVLGELVVARKWNAHDASAGAPLSLVK